MVIIRLLLITFLIAASATTALAGGPYLGVSGGATFPHKSDTTFTSYNYFSNPTYPEGGVTYHTGYAVNAEVGYNFDAFRLEAEFGHKEANTDNASGYSPTAWYTSARVIDSNLTVNSYMVNAYYDFANANIISPFIGGGIGYAKVELNDNRFRDGHDYSVPLNNNFSNEGFAYQLMAGVTGKLVKHVNLDLYYRFMGTTFDLKNGPSTISPYHSSNILAGLRYSF